MADEKKKPEEKEEKSLLEKRMEYIVEAVFDMHIKMVGFDVALRQRHEIIGDKEADYKAMTEDDPYA